MFYVILPSMNTSLKMVTTGSMHEATMFKIQ